MYNKLPSPEKWEDHWLSAWICIILSLGRGLSGGGAEFPNCHNDSLFWTGAIEVGSEASAKP